MTEERNITFGRIVWNGIAIDVSFEPDWLSLGERANGSLVAHLTIRSVEPEKQPLPITETGYRSHFTEPKQIANAGGPVSFVQAWLE